MNNPLRLRSLLLAAFIACGTCASSLAQQPPQARVSPPETVNAEVDGAKLALPYSRPHTKDPKTGENRKIWGGLVPYGKVWRTGANEATTLMTDQPLAFGSATIPAGSYTLFTLPEEGGGAKLIVNKQTGRWGTKYDEKQDLVRVDLKKEATSAPVEQFTMTVGKTATGGSGGVLKMMWENTQYSVPFTVKK